MIRKKILKSTRRKIVSKRNGTTEITTKIMTPQAVTQMLNILDGYVNLLFIIQIGGTICCIMKFKLFCFSNLVITGLCLGDAWSFDILKELVRIKFRVDPNSFIRISFTKVVISALSLPPLLL